MTTMLDVTWVSADPPRFDGGGSNRRQANLLQSLAERASIQVITNGHVDETIRAAAEHVTELAVDVRRAGRPTRAQTVGRLVAGQPDAAARHLQVARALVTAVDQLPTSRLLVVEHDYLGMVRAAVRDRRPASLTFHLLPSRQSEQMLNDATGRDRMRLRAEAIVARRYEHRAARAHEDVVVCSDQDAAHLPGRVTVIPNGVDVDRVAFTPLPPDPIISFVGTMSTIANVDGAAWFARSVLPRIRAEVPAAVLEIVGHDPHQRVLELGNLDGVTVVGSVPDVAPWVERARVSITPLRIGSGTRLKSLEAMASGRPVVGTTVGLEGLGVTHGNEALIADDEAAFASAVVGCLKDHSAVRLASAGRRHVEEHFSWRAIGSKYADHIEDVLEVLAPTP